MEEYELVKELEATFDENLQILLTTNGGLEKVVEEELTERLETIDLQPQQIKTRPLGYDGHVLIELKSGLTTIWPILKQLRSIHHIIFLMDSFSLPQADHLVHIPSRLKQLALPFMKAGRTFRITANRTGNQRYGSMDVQRAAGQLIDERFPCAVDLEQHDINIRVDVYKNQCLIGLQLTNTSLANRYNRSYRPRISLKPHIAYGMVHEANLPNESLKILDPFCGSGSILMEAGHIYPDWDLYGSDLYQNAIEGAYNNLKRENLEGRVELRQADVLELHHYFNADFFDAIITNPPYGIKLSRNKDYALFYKNLLKETAIVLKPGGKLVMLAMKWSQLKNLVVNKTQFTIRKLSRLETGDLHPRLFVLEKIKEV
ncbi:MAG: hypothetical protein BRD49_05375, partial [Bacteroidetes bacterium SW_10_40_5]